ncbi:GNAT family N-acetyltransferase [Devosia aquimaris]|uniref:GNAT family N-acetyltransferase n=1 Tax=Devosia aquimaris TaxID=2866214 RepID=UPI001CD05646|nr:GNAT family N-acetyltransferase [Devosia sp. CJK-A8-3]
MSAVLMASITELCASDHKNDPEAIARWTANKSPDGVLAMLDDAELTMLVAERDGAVVAVGAVRGAEVALNYVAPQARRSGVSKALLGAMEAHMRAQGVTQAHLTSTYTAADFYRAMGWTADAAPVACMGGTGLAMHKPL